jgi:hypothetical protein
MTAEPQHHFDGQICRQCKGLCCQGHPGVWVDPQRFLKSFDLPTPTTPEALQQMLPSELVLRDIEEVAIPAPRKLESGCIFLQADGCQLPTNRRPDQCLALVPALDTLIEGEIRCSLPPEGSTLTAIRAWREFWGQRVKRAALARKS